MNHDPILELIVAEEKQRLQQQTQQKEETQETKDTTETEETESGRVVPDFGDEEDDEVVFIEEREISLQTGVWNKPAADDTLSDLQKVPIEMNGYLEDLVIITDSPDFSVRVEVDDHNVIDDTFNFLQKYSDELSKVSAYDTLDDDYVVAACDYDFEEWFNIEIKPDNDDVTFTIIRVEIERE